MIRNGSPRAKLDVVYSRSLVEVLILDRLPSLKDEETLPNSREATEVNVEAHTKDSDENPVMIKGLADWVILETQISFTSQPLKTRSIAQQ